MHIFFLYIFYFYNSLCLYNSIVGGAIVTKPNFPLEIKKVFLIIKINLRFSDTYNILKIRHYFEPHSPTLTTMYCY